MDGLVQGDNEISTTQDSNLRCLQKGVGKLETLKLVGCIISDSLWEKYSLKPFTSLNLYVIFLVVSLKHTTKKTAK